MKTIISITTAILSSAFLLSCSNSNNEQSTKGAGALEFQLNNNSNHIIVTPSKTVSAVADINTFGIQIHNNAGALIKSWDQYSMVPNMVDLEAGLYKLTASSIATEPDAAFDTPYYLGQKNFVINVQQITCVELLCQIANVKTSVIMSDSFKQFFNNPSVTITNNDLGSLTWNELETKDGYFKVPTLGSLTITASGTRKDNGEVVSFSQSIDNIAPRQWHKININLRTSGSAGITVTIDNTLVETNVDITVPDSNEIIDNNGDSGSWDPQPTI